MGVDSVSASQAHPQHVTGLRPGRVLKLQVEGVMIGRQTQVKIEGRVSVLSHLDNEISFAKISECLRHGKTKGTGLTAELTQLAALTYMAAQTTPPSSLTTTVPPHSATMGCTQSKVPHVNTLNLSPTGEHGPRYSPWPGRAHPMKKRSAAELVATPAWLASEARLQRVPSHTSSSLMPTVGDDKRNQFANAHKWKTQPPSSTSTSFCAASFDEPTAPHRAPRGSIASGSSSVAMPAATGQVLAGSASSLPGVCDKEAPATGSLVGRFSHNSETRQEASSSDQGTRSDAAASRRYSDFMSEIAEARRNLFLRSHTTGGATFSVNSDGAAVDTRGRSRSAAGPQPLSPLGPRGCRSATLAIVRAHSLATPPRSAFRAYRRSSTLGSEPAPVTRVVSLSASERAAKPLPKPLPRFRAAPQAAAAAAASPASGHGATATPSGVVLRARSGTSAPTHPQRAAATATAPNAGAEAAAPAGTRAAALQLEYAACLHTSTASPMPATTATTSTSTGPQPRGHHEQSPRAVQLLARDPTLV